MSWTRSILLGVACLFVVSTALAELPAHGRGLLKSEKELAEQAREEDELEAYFLQQSQLNKEQESLIRFGAEEAQTIVRKLQKASRTTQVKIMADLWANAKGITIVKSLATLIEIRPQKKQEYYALNSDAMDKAESKGYTFKVSEALYNGLAVTDSTADHYHLLDALLYRMDIKNKKAKGSGCQYIQYLFTDAEAWAINDGRTQNFFRGFDHEDYLPIAECFLPACKGSAAKCCADEKAISTGLCACKVINKKKNTMQCEHNLFWTAPRTIWLCGTQDCQPDEKCLCDAKAKKAKKSSTRKGNKSAPKSKGKKKATVVAEPKKKSGKRDDTSSADKNGGTSKKSAKRSSISIDDKGPSKKTIAKKGKNKSSSKKGKGKKTT